MPEKTLSQINEDIVTQPVDPIGTAAPKEMLLSDITSLYEGSVQIQKSLPAPEKSFSVGGTAPTDIPVKSNKLENFALGMADAVRYAHVIDNIKILGGQGIMAYGGYFGKPETIEMGKKLIQTAQNDIDADYTYNQEYFNAIKNDSDTFSYTLGGGATNLAQMWATGGIAGNVAKVLGAGQKLTSIIGTAFGLGANYTMEAAGEVQEGVSVYREKTKDNNLENITPEWAGKEFATTNLYAAGSTVLEAVTGYGKQKEILKKGAKEIIKSGPKEALKGVIEATSKNAVSEGGTEMMQEALNIVIDLFDETLKDENGSIDKEKIKERLYDLAMQGGVGAVLGGTLGLSTAISARQKIYKMVSENLSDKMPWGQKMAITESVSRGLIQKSEEVLTAQLALNSEFRQQHGHVLNNMQQAISQEIDHAIQLGNRSFKELSEDKRAEYVSSTAKLFADQVLAEANHRNVFIEDVLRPLDIRYVPEEGIQLMSQEALKAREAEQEAKELFALKTEKETAEKKRIKEEVYEMRAKARLSQKQRESRGAVSMLDFIASQGGINNAQGDLKAMDAHLLKGQKAIMKEDGKTLDDMGLALYEAGYFAERPTEAEVIEAIDKEMRGGKVYPHYKETIATETPQEEVSAFDEMFSGINTNVDWYKDDINTVVEAIYNNRQASQNGREVQKVSDIDVEGILNEEDAFAPGQPIDEQGTHFNENGELVDKEGNVLFQGKLAKGGIVINTQEEMQGLSEEEFKNKMLETLKSLKGKKIYNESLKGDIEIRTSSIKKYKSFFADKNKRLVVPYIPQLLEKAQFLSENTYTPETEKNIVAYWKADLPINIDSDGYNVHLTVKEDDKGNFFWDAQIKENLQKTAPATNPGGLEVNAPRTDPATNPGDKGHTVRRTVSATNPSVGGLKTENSVYKDSITLERSNVNRYTEERIQIDGKERAVRNSAGQRIAQTEEGLRAFYKWFGDSKIVDQQGKPLKMVHFSDNEFSQFDKSRVGLNGDEAAIGFWFADREDFSFNNEDHPVRYDIYLKMDNPLIIDGKGTEINPFANTDIDNLDPYTKFEKMFNDLMYQDPQMWHETTNELPWGDRETQKLKLHFANFSEERKREVIKGITDKLKAQGHDGIIIKNTQFDSLNPDERINQYIAFEPNQIKSVDNRGTFDPNNDNIYYQRTEAGHAVDLTEAFEDIKGLSPDETVTRIEKHLNDLIGQAIDTATKPLQIQVTEGNKAHVVRSNVDLKPGQKKRHHTALSQLERIINNAVKIDKDGTVDLSHNKRQETIRHKKKIKQYVYFNSPVKIGNDLYHVALTTEQVKGQDPNLLDLYNVQVKKNSSTMSSVTASTLSRSSINNIPLSSEDVNTLLQQKNEPRGFYNSDSKVVRLLQGADYSTLPHEFAHYWLDNMHSYVQAGLASPAYLRRWHVIANWLNVRPEQVKLTRGQQEKFARGYEAYILRGEIPPRPIVSVFDDYEKWLKEVYGEVNKMNVRLSDDAVRFFDSMTTGKLEPLNKATVEANREKLEERAHQQIVQETERLVKESQEVIAERKKSYEKAPITEQNTQKGESAVFKKHAEKLGLDETLEYDKIRLEEENRKAQKFVAENPQAAREIVNGERSLPAGLKENAIYNAYIAQMAEMGNTPEYLNAVINQSLFLTKAGQEIALQRGQVDTLFSAPYWIDQILKNRRMIIAEKLIKQFNGKDKVTTLQEKLKEKADLASKELIKAETLPEKEEIVKRAVENIASELKVKGDKLFQSEYTDKGLLKKSKTKDNAYKYVYRLMEERLGVKVTQEEANNIIQKVEDMRKAADNTRAENGNPSVLFFKNMSELEDYVNSLSPSSWLLYLTSTIGKASMLASIKSAALNIESNGINYFAGLIGRRLINNVPRSAVDGEVIKDFIKYALDVYKASGYSVSSMTELNTRKRILGEEYATIKGDGWWGKGGRFYETFIFKYWMGAPDVWFKNFVFGDSAAVLATQQAKMEGVAEKDLQKRATEIFKDVILIEPQTKEGKAIREKAIQEALIATFQNNTAVSKAMLKIRNTLNDLTKSSGIKAGDFISPFVKTPANVIALGADYTFGFMRPFVHLPSIYHSVKTGKINEETRVALRSLGRGSVGVLMAMLITSFLDDDDYIPDYALTTPSEKNLVREKNGVYNAIKIKDNWVSLDYFGPFGMVLAGVLQWRREKGFIDSIKGFLAGSGTQVLKLPVISDFADLYQNVSENLTADSEKIMNNILKSVIDFGSSRIVPAVISDVAKMFDPKERDLRGFVGSGFVSKIPGLREDLPEKTSITSGKGIDSNDKFNTLLFGARVKKENATPLLKEIDKLSKAGERVTISDIRRSSAFKNLPSEKQQKAVRLFAKMYSKEAHDLIKDQRYQSMRADERANALNKVRRKVIVTVKQQLNLKGQKIVKEKK